MSTMLFGAWIACCCIFASGCDQQQAVGSDVKSNSFQPRLDHVWDCGIVVRGEPTNVSFPLHELGIASGDEIQEINTTCDCVKATVFEYANKRPALRLKIFEEEVDSSEVYQRSVPLNVGLEFRTHSKQIVRHHVRFTLASTTPNE